MLESFGESAERHPNALCNTGSNTRLPSSDLFCLAFSNWAHATGSHSRECILATTAEAAKQQHQWLSSNCLGSWLLTAADSSLVAGRRARAGARPPALAGRVKLR